MPRQNVPISRPGDLALLGASGTPHAAAAVLSPFTTAGRPPSCAISTRASSSKERLCSVRATSQCSVLDPGWPSMGSRMRTKPFSRPTTRFWLENSSSEHRAWTAARHTSRLPAPPPGSSSIRRPMPPDSRMMSELVPTEASVRRVEQAATTAAWFPSSVSFSSAGHAPFMARDCAVSRLHVTSSSSAAAASVRSSTLPSVSAWMSEVVPGRMLTAVWRSCSRMLSASAPISVEDVAV
mmetsp:Transcript_1915/g.4821  ORF Transcript_1915/g.4821 Transcript_1915/m.4821 type:complete len:238 (+) Transcript_1915:1876-2589(+)